MASRNTKGRHYALVMEDGSRKEFSGENGAEALKLAQAILPMGRAAALLEDGVSLAEINYSAAGFWSVSRGRGAGSMT